MEANLIEQADHVYLHEFIAYTEEELMASGEYKLFLKSASTNAFREKGIPLPSEF